jgi:hypothetical protein
MRKLIIIGLIGAAIWWAQSQSPGTPEPSSRAPAETDTLQPEREIARAFAPQPAGSFSCDGRNRCSEMRSCEEAKYFLEHCPGPEMDGDNDGVPCERQWCGGRF